MVLEIVKYGDPVLRAKGRRIEQLDENIRQLAEDMIDSTLTAIEGRLNVRVNPEAFRNAIGS